MALEACKVFCLFWPTELSLIKDEHTLISDQKFGLADYQVVCDWINSVREREHHCCKWRTAVRKRRTTYCRRRYQSPLVALLHWPRSGLGPHSGSWRQSRLTQKWQPGLWYQTCQHGPPEFQRTRNGGYTWKCFELFMTLDFDHFVTLQSRKLGRILSLDWLCEGMCQNPLACRSWKQCWLSQYPCHGQKG